MEWLLFIPLAFIAFMLHALSVVHFKRVFYLYLGVFVPCYGLFLELCSRITPHAASPAITAIKDYVWILLLLSFLIRLLMRADVCRFPRSLTALLLLYVVYGLLTIPRGISSIGPTGLALGVRNAFMYVPAALIAACLIQDGEDLLALIGRFRVIMIIVGLYALAQLTFGIESTFNVLRGRPGLKNVLGSTFVSYIELSYFSCLCAALLIAGFKWLPGRVLTVIGLGSAVFCLVACQSRTGLIVFVLILVPFAFAKARLFAGTSLVAATVVALLVVFNPEILSAHRLHKTALVTSRFSTWLSMTTSFVAHPVLGYGLGAFGPAAFKAAQMGTASMLKVNYVDSFFITTILNLGLLGLSFFLLLVAYVFASMRRLIRRLDDPQTVDAISGLRVVLLINLVYSVFFNMIDGFPGSPYFWFFVGAACALDERAYDRMACCPGQLVVPEVATL